MLFIHYSVFHHKTYVLHRLNIFYRVFITSDLTGAQCSPSGLHWAYDTYMLAKSTGGAMVKAGGDSWFFITADYAFGHALERDTTKFVKEAGGKVVAGKGVRTAPNTLPPAALTKFEVSRSRAWPKA